MKLRRRSRGVVAVAPPPARGIATSSRSPVVATGGVDTNAPLFPPDALSLEDSLLDDEFPRGFIVDDEVSEIMLQELPLLVNGDHAGTTIPHHLPTSNSSRNNNNNNKQPAWFVNIPQQRTVSPASAQVSSNSFRKSDDHTDEEIDFHVDNSFDDNSTRSPFRILGIQPNITTMEDFADRRVRFAADDAERSVPVLEDTDDVRDVPPRTLLEGVAFAYTPSTEDDQRDLVVSPQDLFYVSSNRLLQQQQRQQRDGATTDSASLTDNDSYVRPVDIQVITGMLQANHQKEQERKRVLKYLTKEQQRLERKQEKRVKQERRAKRHEKAQQSTRKKTRDVHNQVTDVNENGKVSTKSHHWAMTRQPVEKAKRQCPHLAGTAECNASLLCVRRKKRSSSSNHEAYAAPKEDRSCSNVTNMRLRTIQSSNEDGDNVIKKSELGTASIFTTATKAKSTTATKTTLLSMKKNSTDSKVKSMCNILFINDTTRPTKQSPSVTDVPSKHVTEQKIDNIFTAASKAVSSMARQSSTKSARSAKNTLATSNPETHNLSTLPSQAVKSIATTKTETSDKNVKRGLEKLRETARVLTKQRSWTKRLPSFEGHIFRRNSKPRSRDGSVLKAENPEAASKSASILRSSSASTNGSKSRSSSRDDDRTEYSEESNDVNQGLVEMITRALGGDAWDEEDSIEEYREIGEEESFSSYDAEDSSIREAAPVSTPSRFFLMRGNDSDDCTSTSEGDEDLASDLRSALDDFLDSSCICCSPMKSKHR